MSKIDFDDKEPWYSGRGHTNNQPTTNNQKPKNNGGPEPMNRVYSTTNVYLYEDQYTPIYQRTVTRANPSTLDSTKHYTEFNIGPVVFFVNSPEQLLEISNVALAAAAALSRANESETASEGNGESANG